MSDLPTSWTVTGIEETLLPFENGQTLRQGWSPQCERFPSPTPDDWGVLKTTAIQDGEFQPEHNKKLPAKLEPDGLLEVKEGDLLLTCAGPRVRCGVTCLVRKTRPRLMVSGKMYRFRTDPRIAVPAYLEAFLRSHDTKKRIDAMKTGISDSGLNLTLSRFKTLQVPLPPTAEQRRIVAKVEELFSELDEGAANLKKARAQLAVYRQALLKHALEGHLTADWRTQHAQELESADQLLARIRAEREERYQKQIKEWTVNRQGRQPKRAPAVDTVPPDESAKLANHPPHWCIFRLGEIMSVASGAGLTAGAMIPGDHFVYGGNGVSGRHSEYMFAEPKLIIGRVGAKCGAVHVTSPKSWVTDNALVVDILCDIPSMSFLKLKFTYENFNRLSVSTAQPVVSGARLYAHIIALPPTEEQRIIVDQLETQLSAIDALEADIDQNLQKAEALRQSILKKAFAGELVPQDPADEPAAALLARIRAERETATTAKPGKPRKAKKP